MKNVLPPRLLAIAFSLCAACGSDGTASGGSDASIDSDASNNTTPSDLGVTDGAACRGTPHVVGETQHSLAPSEYFLHVPDSYDPSVPIPLVIALHGTGGDGQSWLDQCAVRSTADDRGFIVASPSAWDEHLQFGYDQHGENEFMETMIEEISECYSIDPTRRYMFGFSQGGFYSIFYCMIGHEASMTACGGFGAHAPWEGFNQQYDDEGRKLPFYLVTGANDSLYIDRARDFQVGLELSNYPHYFDAPAGLGHSCPDTGLAPMYDWWVQQGPLSL